MNLIQMLLKIFFTFKTLLKFTSRRKQLCLKKYGLMGIMFTPQMKEKNFLEKLSLETTNS